jgi:hypothetical protein
MSDRKLDSPFTDHGRGFTLPKDLSWINHPPYRETTPLYLGDYQMLGKMLPTLETYLSLGSGLGRQIILAYSVFPRLRSVTSVDNHLFLHQSVKELPINFRLIHGQISNVVKSLKQEAVQFDLVAIENVREHGLE